MADPGDLPQPDRIEGAPHPRETATIYGQHAAEAAFLDAFNAGRLHHAWLLSGPRGVGKATLAWRIARFLRAAEPAETTAPGLFGEAPAAPASLDIPAEHPVARLVAAGAEPGIFPLRRGPRPKPHEDKLSADIRVEEVRRMRSFFALSVVDGGRRVVIVDTADEMNPQAANALLKNLEEPPAGTVFLLVSHQPSRLLPTIRSRCRDLRLPALGPDDLARALTAAGTDPGSEGAALAELAGGSVGVAVQLMQGEGLGLYREIAAIFEPAPRFERARAEALAGSLAGAANAPRLDLAISLIETFLARLALAGSGAAPAAEAAPGEAALLARLAPDAGAARRWAALQQNLTARAAHARAVNLDPVALILDMVFRINETAAAAA